MTDPGGGEAVGGRITGSLLTKPPKARHGLFEQVLVYIRQLDTEQNEDIMSYTIINNSNVQFALIVQRLS